MASLGLVPISQPHELSQNEVYAAWVHYTGLPEAVSGGVGVVGINAVIQGGQAKGMLKLQLPGYPKTFGAAFKGEFFWGTVAIATILTFIDPEHKIEGGGLDETRFYKEHLEGSWTNIKGFGKEVAMAEVIPGRSLF
jgi:hypothetical protein